MRLSKSIPWPEDDDNINKDIYYRSDGKVVNKYFYDFDIIWTDCAHPAEKFSTLKTYQKTNHFPGMMALSRKNYLSNNINKMKKKFVKEYNFIPRTWVLPTDITFLRKYVAERTQGKKKVTLIIKPEAGCQGKGIFLAKNLNFNTCQTCVVQR